MRLALHTHPTRPAAERLVALGLALALLGCGIFTPEDPPPPGGPTAGRSLPLLTVDPDSALESMVIGLETGSIDFYRHAFTDSQVSTDVSFHAFFDPQDLLEFQTGTGTPPPTDWRYRDEDTFFPQFVGLRPVAYQVYLFPDTNRPDNLISPDQDVIYYRRYRIWAQSVPVAVGLADLRIKRVGVSGEWKIVHWEDRRDTTASIVLTYGRRRLDSLQ